MSETHIAIIGAGIAGLACAQRLQNAGLSVTVFDKARGPGGRICTRRTDTSRFDHGAPYFTVSHPGFASTVEEWSNLGCVKPWKARFGRWSNGTIDEDTDSKERWVGTPRMSMIGKMMAQGIDVRLQHKITAIHASDNRWSITANETEVENPYDWVVLTCPGPQAVDLLPTDTVVMKAARSLSYAPCWALMLGFDAPLVTPFDGIHLDHPILSWAARDSSKPDRAPGERWVVHAQPQWSQAHIHNDPEDIIHVMTSAFEGIIGAALSPTHSSAHRWLYSRSISSPIDLKTIDIEARLAICGDGLEGPNIENAWFSGNRMAESILMVMP